MGRSERLVMLRHVLVLPSLLIALGFAHAQRAEPTTTSEDKGPFLGVLFTSVSEALYDQLPQLSRKHGVLVTHVLPESPAATAEIRKNDILLKYDDHKIRGCEDFANLIRSSKPDQKVTLQLLRGGKETSVDVVIALGPALKIADSTPRAGGSDAADLPKGVAKPGGPPPISVAATPLEQGRMRVSIEFLPEGASRLRTVTCEGSATEIDTEVDKLPERERVLVRQAIARIRELTSEKAPNKRVPGS
jgi:membrane-associated protease RseP (regulator of RpoE activity)